MKAFQTVRVEVVDTVVEVVLVRAGAVIVLVLDTVIKMVEVGTCVVRHLTNLHPRRQISRT